MLEMMGEIPGTDSDDTAVDDLLNALNDATESEDETALEVDEMPLIEAESMNELDQLDDINSLLASVEDIETNDANVSVDIEPEMNTEDLDSLDELDLDDLDSLEVDVDPVAEANIEPVAMEASLDDIDAMLAETELPIEDELNLEELDLDALAEESDTEAISQQANLDTADELLEELGSFEEANTTDNIDITEVEQPSETTNEVGFDSEMMGALDMDLDELADSTEETFPTNESTPDTEVDLTQEMEISESIENQLDEDIAEELPELDTEISEDVNMLTPSEDKDLPELSELTDPSESLIETPAVEEPSTAISDEAVPATQTDSQVVLQASQSIENMEEAISIDQEIQTIASEVKETAREATLLAIATTQKAHASASQTQAAIEATFAAAERAFEAAKNAGYSLELEEIESGFSDEQIEQQLTDIKAKNHKLKEVNSSIKSRIAEMKAE